MDILHVGTIEQDFGRFRQIVRGKIKQHLKQYMSNGEMIGKKGKDFISIPVPQIDLPTFKFGRKGAQGVGQGEGEPGDILAPGDSGDGSGGAGNAPGSHILEVDLTLGELAEILGEELALPRIQPKGKREILASKYRFTSERMVGPESLKRFKSTFKRALKRQLASGTYDPENPNITFVREDRRYLSWKEKPQPEASALIVYIMDVSGSMGDEQKEIARLEAFWIDTWIQFNYKNVQTMYIIHDSVASRVDRETFFHTRESGGTVISSAYTLCLEELRAFPEDQWNVYMFQFSDGDNWAATDTDECIRMLRAHILPRVNLFGYAQTTTQGGSGGYFHALKNNDIAHADNLVISEVEKKDDIYQSIKDFLGKGK